MNAEKLKQLEAQVRIGGKVGTCSEFCQQAYTQQLYLTLYLKSRHYLMSH
jgi:hypothetical protein